MAFMSRHVNFFIEGELYSKMFHTFQDPENIPDE